MILFRFETKQKSRFSWNASKSKPAFVEIPQLPATMGIEKNEFFSEMQVLGRTIEISSFMAFPNFWTPLESCLNFFHKCSCKPITGDSLFSRHLDTWCALRTKYPGWRQNPCAVFSFRRAECRFLQWILNREVIWGQNRSETRTTVQMKITPENNNRKGATACEISIKRVFRCAI